MNMGILSGSTRIMRSISIRDWSRNLYRRGRCLVLKQAISLIEVSRGMRIMWSGDCGGPCQQQSLLVRGRVPPPSLLSGRGGGVYLGIGVVDNNHFSVKV